jgi:predicted Zn-ribbon and HTH transcriptional regulator
MEKYLKLMKIKFTLNVKNVINMVETNDEEKILNDIEKILNEIGKILNDIEKIVKDEEIFNLIFYKIEKLNLKSKTQGFL